MQHLSRHTRTLRLFSDRRERNRKWDLVIFIQDGAPAHYTLPVHDVHNARTFGSVKMDVSFGLQEVQTLRSIGLHFRNTLRSLFTVKILDLVHLLE